LGNGYAHFFQTLWNYQSILLGLRFVLSFLVLLLPATAMGLTLPVFSHIFRWRCVPSQKLRCHSGRVYSRIEPQADRYRGYFKGGIRPRDLYSGPFSSNPLRDPRVTAFVQDGRFFLQGSPRQYDIKTGEPPPPKVAGSVNLYTEEFFSLMNDRLKEGGIATFWLPVDQLKVSEAKAILRAFRNAFPNTSVWAGADEEWIMMGIKGPGRRVQEGKIRRLWSDSGTGGTSGASGWRLQSN
jgi:hypothetical protein